MDSRVLVDSRGAFKEGGGCEFKGVLVNSRGCL